MRPVPDVVRNWLAAGCEIGQEVLQHGVPGTPLETGENASEGVGCQGSEGKKIAVMAPRRTRRTKPPDCSRRLTLAIQRLHLALVIAGAGHGEVGNRFGNEGEVDRRKSQSQSAERVLKLTTRAGSHYRNDGRALRQDPCDCELRRASVPCRRKDPQCDCQLLVPFEILVAEARKVAAKVATTARSRAREQAARKDAVR